MGSSELERLVVDARPRLSWRIGVSGHRKLPQADTRLLNAKIERIFDEIEAALASLQKQPVVEQIFAPVKPQITFISPLAEGADRICAEIAIKKRIPLGSPLPFAIDEYKKDFPATAPEFDRLLESARCNGGGVVELDGKPAPPAARDAAYLAVGEFVVRNCDTLIAIWDGEVERGTGGTAQIVERARRSGVPVIHIHAAAPHEMHILDPNTVPERLPYSATALSDMIARQVVPRVRVPHPHDPLSGQKDKREPSLGPADTYFRKERVQHTGKEPDYLYQGPFRPDMPWYLRALASVFPWFVRRLGKKVPVPGPQRRPPPVGTEEATVRYLFLHHHRADVLAIFYANLHRSVFMLVYALSAAALIFAVLALYTLHTDGTVYGVPWMYVFTGCELAVLLAITGLVMCDNGWRWRDRWLEYRLLAELLREADLLAQVGRPMPFNRIDELAEDLPGRAWVMVAFRAIARRSGLVSQKYDASFLATVRDYAASTRLQDQIAYHYGAEARDNSIGRYLTAFGRVTFVATGIAAALKLAPHGLAVALLRYEDLVDFLPALAGIFPALAYAAFGIRNQAEFEIVSRRSERMIAKLTRQQERIGALNGDCLSSEALGREILHAAAIMRHDAADWTSIFEVKETEAA